MYVVNLALLNGKTKCNLTFRILYLLGLARLLKLDKS